MRLIRPSGVYPPQDDTALLAEAVRREPGTAGGRVLDVGTGTGALALLAARCRAARVDAVDISPRAVATAWLNARLCRAPVRVRLGGLPDPATGGRFDVVLANPPYVPTPPSGLPPHARGRSFDAGPDGRAVLDDLCARAPSLLRPGGVLLIVQSALSGAGTTLERLRAQGLRTEVTARRVVPFGPVLRGRSTWLASRGLIAPGEDKEELVVIRAVRTAHAA
ncbi:HemK2/MTQ2 family protein methyltransferase [Streptomyces sp. ME19-01-6]|uniref:HemK2/MTQ2 family protein methyltransferase n=1 Tax=Streptomyces sp. ME19-01-6 TaxID=3028686 RepID=UPI0029A1448E|nr:HemK2/MTQ2 family protein methyltransferase [Streptomyces sp. ME19-01-6]MDX3228089.1 methyltransferase [Streptomyces sp. ME19-01-6]